MHAVPNNAPGEVYDVIIIGGGPAGATAAALIASEGRRVLVLEKARFPRAKLCGEFISPECMSIFEKLGVRAAIEKAGARPIRRMDLISPDGRAISIPSRWFAGGLEGALGLTRARLDAILLDRAAELGAEIQEGMHVTPLLESGGSNCYVEAKDHEANTHRYSARLIINASGRGQLFGREAVSPRISRRRRRLFAGKVHMRGVTGLDSTGELYFFGDGYGGLTEVEPDEGGRRFNLCFLTTETKFKEARGDRDSLLETTVMRNPVARERLRNAVPCDEWIGAGPLVFGSQKSPRGVLAIGDAGAFIDPFTGSGILLALRSGELAATAVLRGSRGSDTDVEEVVRIFESLNKNSVGWRFRIAALLRQLAVSGTARRLMVPLLMSHSGLTRLLARSTRERDESVLVSNKE